MSGCSGYNEIIMNVVDMETVRCLIDTLVHSQAQVERDGFISIVGVVKESACPCYINSLRKGETQQDSDCSILIEYRKNTEPRLNLSGKDV